jgi:hypothetical protein
MPAAAQRVRTRVSLPRHAYADKHKLLLASREAISRRRRLRDAADLIGVEEIACIRIREFAFDVGIEGRDGKRWMAYAARELGINKTSMRAIILGEQTAVGIKTINRIARKTGIKVSFICDPTE